MIIKPEDQTIEKDKQFLEELKKIERTCKKQNRIEDYTQAHQNRIGKRLSETEKKIESLVDRISREPSRLMRVELKVQKAANYLKGAGLFVAYFFHEAVGHLYGAFSKHDDIKIVDEKKQVRKATAEELKTYFLNAIERTEKFVKEAGVLAVEAKKNPKDAELKKSAAEKRTEALEIVNTVNENRLYCSSIERSSRGRDSTNIKKKIVLRVIGKL